MTKAAWKASPLGEVCTVFTDGDWVETKDQSSDGIRLIQTGNVGCGEFKNRSDKARYVDEETFHRLNCQEVLPGDCLVSRLPDPVGRACLVPDLGAKMITAVDCTIIRFDETAVEPDFFCYYAQSRQYLSDVESWCTGATRKRISRKNLGKIRVPQPPVSEQKRIVAILDEVFAGIDAAVANAEKNLANAREVFESFLNSFFIGDREGWKQVRLGEVFDTVTGNTPSKKKAELYGDHLPFVKPPELRDDVVESAADNLSQLGAEVARVAPADTVLVSCIGNLGKVAISSTPVAFNQQINAILPKLDAAFPRFMFYQALSARFRGQLEDVAACTTVPIVNKTKFNGVTVSLAPLAAQREIARRLDDVRAESARLKDAYRGKLTALAELKQSILQKAVAGELTAKEADRQTAAA